MNKILPNTHLKKYQLLLELLGQLQETVVNSVNSADTLNSVTQVETNHFLELQNFYQQQMFPLGEENFGAEVSPETASRWRSLNTEIHRSMKLLALDISLLKAARSPQMQKTRREGIIDRLSTLISYCKVVII